jgi:glycosyltransferase involved in cell wall biosynthesis
MTESPAILIAMPLFEGWEHVAETLNSIKRQTYENYRVLISVDGGDQRSFAACQPYIKDPRFELVLQPTRLYWGGNINWLAGQLREDFFSYWQHDDYCDPKYLETLIEYAKRHPQASSVYCDMKVFGIRNGLIKYPSVTGFALQRVLRQVTNPDAAVIRCLIRADALRRCLPIKLASTWCLALARAGELHRVPEVLYFRRRRAEGLTNTMLLRPPQVMWAASLDWAMGVLEHTHPLIQKNEEVRLFSMIADLVVNQQIRGKWQYDFTAADRSERLRFVADFLAQAQARFGLTPFAEMLTSDDPHAALQERKGRAGAWDGEDLIVDTVLGDLPSFLTATPNQPRI